MLVKRIDRLKWMKAISLLREQFLQLLILTFVIKISDMNTNQIKEFCKKLYNNVFLLDCVPIDQLDNEKILKDLCGGLVIAAFLIFNINPKSAPGRHWILLIRLCDVSLFIFDSFGSTVPDDVLRFKNFGSEVKRVNKRYHP